MGNILKTTLTVLLSWLAVKISHFVASNDMKVSDKLETMWKEAFVG
jgi:hypothetical protein